MNHLTLNTWRIVGRKLSVILLLVISAATYATLGDGKGRSGVVPRSSLLSNKTLVRSGSFSLRSGYSYRGNLVINNNGEKRYIQLNTVVTLQKGSTTFIVPLKKKALLDNVKIDFSNRQLRRN
jgi:hypothetical protein